MGVASTGRAIDTIGDRALLAASFTAILFVSIPLRRIHREHGLHAYEGAAEAMRIVITHLRSRADRSSAKSAYQT